MQQSHNLDNPSGQEQIGTKPQAMPVNLVMIPPALKAIARWVVWRYVEDVDRNTGEISWDKPPANARNGNLASSTNPATWSAFQVAADAYQQGEWDGVGFVLNRDSKDDGPGLIGVDLDKCRNPETGEIEPWAWQIVTELNSYTEISPSGRGLRIFIYGTLPPDGRKKKKFECYTTGRYLTITGQRVEINPEQVATIEDRPEEILRVHRAIFGEPMPVNSAPLRGGLPSNLSDLELIEKASRARNGAKFRALWNGDIGAAGSHSEADLALCNYLAFWCGPNSEGRIADLFAQSGLFRSKWQREDYRERTIKKALAGRTEFYDPGRNGHSQNNGDAVLNADANPLEDHWAGKGDAYEGPDPVPPKQSPLPRRYHFHAIPSATFFTNDYRQEYLIQRVLVALQAGVMGGAKKVLKTSVGVDLVISLATGTDFLNRFRVYKPRRVLMISGESGEPTLQETGRRVCAVKGIDPAAMDLLYWSFQLPQISDPVDRNELRAGLEKLKIEVAFLDPLYLSLLGVGNPKEIETGNLFSIGPLLREMAQTCLDVGCTPILCHHARKNVLNRHDPMELDDLSFAGIAEFARQWLLISRRQEYEPGTGSHKLWLTSGGSAGHGGLWGVDVEEGVLDEEFKGRTWSVSVFNPQEVREMTAGESEKKAQSKESAREQREEIKLLIALDEVDKDRKGVSLRQVRLAAGLSPDKATSAAFRLRQQGILEQFEAPVITGSGATRTATCIRRKGEKEVDE